MAAYAALVSLTHVIHQIENHRFPPIFIDRQQVESLTKIVTSLQKFLECYNSPVADSNEADPLEMCIRDAAYATEDVIESYIVDVIKLPVSTTTNHQEIDSEEETSSVVSKILQMILFMNCLRGPRNPKKGGKKIKNEEFLEQTSCIHFYQNLQQVIEEMDLIKKVATKINREKELVHDQQRRNVSASVVLSRSSSSIMVGSHDALPEIMHQLTGGRRDRQVTPIVGMSGIGKTTLARTIYSQSLIKEHFDICAWTTISQQYNTREILCEVLSQVSKESKEKVNEMSEDELGSRLHKYLFGRRFLIVMDDMWGIEVWDRIQRFLPNNENCSRILVTTRLSKLSSQLNNNYSLQMNFLDEVTSWNLFSKTVFGEKSCPLELEEIGKKIVENCRGLPLSIVVVGGLLKKMEHTQGCWESIRDNLTAVVNLENDKHCFKLLKMSYNHLPAYLKPCFLYMGVFEEDRVIRVSKLTRLWVSEGLVKPTNGKSLETIAKGFLKDLVDRNLILIHELGTTGNIRLCKIHDLLTDLCLKEGQKDGFYHVVEQRSPRDEVMNRQGRRVVIPRSTSKEKILDALQSMSHVRSIICDNKVFPSCQNFGLLRTLHAAYDNYADQSYVNSLVFECVNLQHLHVEVFRISSFLFAVNHLWNLHTLIVSCFYDCNAPLGIWKMPQFRHIEFVRNPLCLPDPPSSNADAVILENLQTLKGVMNFKCSEEVVKRIVNIKKLSIQYGKVDEGSSGLSHDDYYCLSNIECLCKLESLSVSCNDDRFRGVPDLHRLTFPHSLESLSLRMKDGIDFEFEDMLEKIGSLPLLQKLKLTNGCFGRGKWEIVEGQFPCLKFLLLAARGLKEWTAEESSNIFPRLELLFLGRLEELEEIPCEIGNIATLQKILLGHCSESAVKSAKEIVEEQVELQGEQLTFHVEVWLSHENEALQSLAAPNFEVSVITT